MILICPRCVTFVNTARNACVFSRFFGLRFADQVWDYMPETLQTEGVAKASYALLGVSGAISLGLAAV